MAPPKTMAVSQQNQQQQQQQQVKAKQNQTTGRLSQGDQATTVKSRKRKDKQHSVASQQEQSAAPSNGKQQVIGGRSVAAVLSNAANGKENLDKTTTPASIVKQLPIVPAPDQQQAIPVTPHERQSIKKQQQQQQTQSNQVPSSPVKKESSNNSTSARGKQSEIASIVPVAANTVLAKQISTEEPDDIDAGIELDGSSNSGSSVKDINEDQIKSASVSPVMAQSNVVNEERDRTKHAVEVAPIGQLAGSLCHDIAPASKKAGLTTKQQLAANQQVIDADEQQLQQKLQNKQRKPSLASSQANNTSLASLNTSIANTTTASSQGAPQSPALCKICEQHVYQMERLMAEKAVYHKSCFRCFQCKTQLRIDNYSSHEGQVYCKAHHRQILQPQVKLDNEDDVDIVAKSTAKVVDDYLLQRGRLSDLSFSFLQPKPEEIQKRQMIICENEPAELPKDVVRCDTKVDDGIDRLNLNLNNILEKFERGNNGDESQPSSAGVNIEKPSFNIKKTLMAFETKSINPNDDEDPEAKSTIKTERPVVKKLTNLNGFLNRQSSTESSETSGPVKPLAVRRSESLMLRLKKYESRIAGEQVVDDDDDDDDDNENAEDVNNNSKREEANNANKRENITPRKLTSLKSQWENGDISKRRSIENYGEQQVDGSANTTSDNCNGHSPAAEKNEELIRIRQQLARKRSGGSSSIKNIYENAIKEAQSVPTPKLNSSDLSALNGFSTSEIQQQLLQNGSHDDQKSSTPSTPNKDHFQLNLSKKANKLRERFEQGLINNSSYDDSDEENDGDSERNISKLEQIRQEKLEDLSIFTEGEIKAREARSMFQQIDRRLSAANGQTKSLPPNSRSLATISASMQAKLQGQRQPSTTAENSAAQNGASRNSDLNLNSSTSRSSNNHLDKCEPSSAGSQKPIRLINNVRT